MSVVPSPSKSPSAAVVVEVGPEEQELMLGEAARRCDGEKPVTSRREGSDLAGVRTKIDFRAILVRTEIAQQVDAFKQPAARGPMVKVSERIHIRRDPSRRGRAYEYRLRDLLVR